MCSVDGPLTVLYWNGVKYGTRRVKTLCGIPSALSTTESFFSHKCQDPERVVHSDRGVLDLNEAVTAEARPARSTVTHSTHPALFAPAQSPASQSRRIGSSSVSTSSPRQLRHPTGRYRYSSYLDYHPPTHNREPYDTLLYCPTSCPHRSV